MYIASADYMTRNTLRRVEVAAPVLDDTLRERLDWMFDTMMKDDEKVKELLAPLKECGPYIIWDDLDRSIQIAKNIPKSFCEKDLELIWQCVKEVDERVLVEANKLENER